MYVCMFACLHVCMYVCMYVCVCVCVSRYTYVNAAYEYSCAYVRLRPTSSDSYIVTLLACMCIILGVYATNDACTGLLQVAVLLPAVPARHLRAVAAAAAARHQAPAAHRESHT